MSKKNRLSNVPRSPSMLANAIVLERYWPARNDPLFKEYPYPRMKTFSMVFYQFSASKIALSGLNFQNSAGVKKAVQQLLASSE
ncbi:hypothetical protein TNIN_237301 [Trichonephila inaurata madagascariensis]|uniref:Uncharacterized protein n=1 Tax=Trichonephila inaurata madagascariensis TaxID=2747483 RepID=A0A8X6YVV9_9ARAC|nr:hypothetical protein TNIN_237301 [Trichonephila inaurata madagascariensis]